MLELKQIRSDDVRYNSGLIFNSEADQPTNISMFKDSLG